MANRVVRGDILESESVNKLTWAGEVFYRRLMSILDDYGRCDGRIVILRGKLYVLKIDKVSESDVEKWLTECVNAGLVRIYHVDNKPYLELFNFGQTLRAKKARFPAPPDYDEHMQADASMCLSETERKQKQESETETLRGLPFETEAFHIAWAEWDKYRREKKQALTASTIEKQLKFLGAKSEEVAISIIDQSITNGWTGLFPIKNNTSKKQEAGVGVRPYGTNNESVLNKLPYRE